MRVSVIIPVFNAAAYVEQAVASALQQPEVIEILLIEDKSSDNSYSVCENLKNAHQEVRLLTHDGHVNMGAGASRNLGLREARAEYIAFLDADDFYLEGRFRETSRVFESHPDAGAVYETIGVIYEDPELRKAHMRRTGGENTGINTRLQPDQVFRALATGQNGYIHLDGLVVRKSMLDPDMVFDTALRQCQDSDWIMRLASRLQMYPADPAHIVANRRVHIQNRVNNTMERIRYQRAFLRKCIREKFYGSEDRYANLYLIARYVSWSANGFLRKLPAISGPAIVISTLGYLIIHPKILLRLVFAQ